MVECSSGTLSAFSLIKGYYHSCLRRTNLDIGRTLQLGARWTVFDCNLVRVIHIASGTGSSWESNARSRLKDCLLCIAADGSVAVVALDGLLL
jgi:hypothetical protein